MNKFFEQILEQTKGKNPFYIRVKVLPKSSVNDITERLEDGTYKIRIKAPATDGKANAELCKFLKKSLGANEVSLSSGQTDRVNLVKISLFR